MSSDAYPWDNFRNRQDIDPTLCFILSPFKPEFSGPRQILEDVAADDIQRPGTIHADIWDHIQRAAIIVADITDANANVMLELGVASTIKEHFRVILIVRKGATDGVPFDLRPFRYISYEDTLAGSRQLRDQIREYFKFALSEDNILSSVEARMEEWEKSEHHYALLPYDQTLGRLRGFSRINEASPKLLAYLLAASIQHGVDLDWWTQLNRSNIYAAEVAVEILLGPWIRPQFRAAYSLQNMSDELRQIAVSKATLLTEIPLVQKLLDAILKKSVVDFTMHEASGLLIESQRYELLQNFTTRARVHLT
jgi:hypothetical protein